MNKSPNFILCDRFAHILLKLGLALFFTAIFLVLALDAEACHRKRYHRKFVVEVVSSAPHQVTGGDARLHIEVPKNVPVHRVMVLVNGTDQSDRFERIEGTRILTGVVEGLQIGQNIVKVKANGRGWGRPKTATLKLINYPTTGPVFSGPHQYPFVCTVQDHGLGQAIVDNDSEGYPVFAEDAAGNPTEEVIGFSRDCSVDGLVHYVYRSIDGQFKAYTPGGDRPADMAQTTTTDGLTVDYVVRWERGTINRF